MRVETKSVESTGMVLGCGVVSVLRKTAEANSAIPSAESVSQACKRFRELQLDGMATLIETVQQLETKTSVVGYFGFTIDKDGLMHKPLAEGETQIERSIKIMMLPHPQWGNRRGTATVLQGLTSLSEDPKLDDLVDEHRTLLSNAFAEAAMFLARGSSISEV